MIAFACPGCKAALQVADEHAGATIQCPNCNAMATAPRGVDTPAMAITAAPHAVAPPPASTSVTTPENVQGGPSERRRADEDRPRRPRDDAPAKAAAGMGVGMILLLVFGIGCCIVVPVLVALMVPAVQKVREAAARTQSTNNLMQIGLAMHSFHDANKQLPYNGSGDHGRGADRNKHMSGSWAYQILPYIDQGVLFQNVDRNASVPTYMCPGRGRPGVEAGGGAWTDYFYNNYLNNAERASQPDAPYRGPKMSSIFDGSSNTIFVGHGNISRLQYAQVNNVTLSSNIFQGGTFGTARAGNDGETAPTGVILRRDDDTQPTFASWGGPFPHGALMAMGDGTVRMFPYHTQQFSSFLTPRGGEIVVIPD